MFSPTSSTDFVSTDLILGNMCSTRLNLHVLHPVEAGYFSANSAENKMRAIISPNWLYFVQLGQCRNNRPFLSMFDSSVLNFDLLCPNCIFLTDLIVEILCFLCATQACYASADFTLTGCFN